MAARSLALSVSLSMTSTIKVKSAGLVEGTGGRSNTKNGGEGVGAEQVLSHLSLQTSFDDMKIASHNA